MVSALSWTEFGVLDEASPDEQRAIEAQNMGVIMTQLNELRRNPAISVISENLEGVKVEGGIGLFLTYLFPAFTVMFIFFIVGVPPALLCCRSVRRAPCAACWPHPSPVGQSSPERCWLMVCWFACRL